MPGPIWFRAWNHYTQIFPPDDLILRTLDLECRYPTQHAEALGTGWRPPMGEGGGWDGWIRLLRRPKTQPPYAPTGLLPRLCRVARRMGYEPHVDDKRERPPEGVPEFPKLELRDYQEAAVDAAIKMGRGVLDLPPRAGKTRMAAELQRRLGLNTLWLAPTDRIVSQTVDVLEEHFGKHFAARPESAAHAAELAHTRVVCMTAAMASRLTAEWCRTRDVVIVDEWHHCLSPTTRVQTATGWAPIATLRVGDLVWASGPGGLRLQPIARVWRRSAPGVMLRIVTTRGTLEVTSEHEIYTPTGKRRAGELRVGGTVSVRQMWSVDCSQGALGGSRAGLSWAGYGHAEMPDVRRCRAEAQLRGPSSVLLGAQFHGRPFDACFGNEKAEQKRGISEISSGTDAWGAQSGKASGRRLEASSGMEGSAHGLRALWAWGRGQGERADPFGSLFAGGIVGSRLPIRVQDCHRQSQRGAVVLTRRRSRGRAHSRGSGREQSCFAGENGCSEGCFFDGSGLGGGTDIGVGRASGRGLGIAEILSIAAIEPPSDSVFDLEVTEDHNYFAEGVLVSNSASKTYTKDIFPKLDHVFYRYGMTGTHFRSGDDAMAMHALLSETIYRLSPLELLQRGHLVPTHVCFVPVGSPRLRGVGRTFHGGFGTAGVHEHEDRTRMAVEAALSLHTLGRRVMVLVGTKSQGRAIQGALRQCLPLPPPAAEFEAVEFLSTDRPRRVQQGVIDSFLTSQEVKILIGTTILGEGVDLPAADALVYARGEKAEVSLTQAVYRVGTADGAKKAAIVVDFADRHHKHLLEHSLERLRLYYREPTFTLTILDDPGQLAGWAAKVP